MFEDNKELDLLVKSHNQTTTTHALRLWNFQATYKILKALVKEHPAVTRSIEKKCPIFSENMQIFGDNLNSLMCDFANPYYDREVFEDQLNNCRVMVETIASDFGAPVEIIR